jgi:hypothetical protein
MNRLTLGHVNGDVILEALKKVYHLQVVTLNILCVVASKKSIINNFSCVPSSRKQQPLMIYPSNHVVLNRIPVIRYLALRVTLIFTSKNTR